ncbi:Histidinol phosphatase [Frankia canadensis]|uniref:Histidinol-phosphatase n=1 Tax=Frankia canadensis TaxID=1836972 RepID=A0A2I2KP09_9ACTN|nr:PHP domain-containing protein [Frankia canadensis]SNQ47390.1 Histidinol phosphatase [Frankia canadensis]SOU54680.1 Histidinol phosphatase [Frankia canadensis]
MLPADSHVHSEWSWDALAGSMERTCRRAVELGLPSVAFTEHADLTAWTIPPGETLPDAWLPLVDGAVVTPPPLDLDGYQACLHACRERHPGLRVLSGVELGEPHWHATDAHALLTAGGFERILASVHCAPTVDGRGFTDISACYDDQPPLDVVRSYLAEAARLVEGFDGFEVLAHIDYPIRRWPAHARPHDPRDAEDDYRHVLRLLAASGRILEINTRVPMHPLVPRWWHEEGGDAITFASDAHEPDALARGFRDAIAVAEAAGFRPTDDPHAFWRRA